MLVPLASTVERLAAKSPTQRRCRKQMARENRGMPPSKSRVSLDSAALPQISTPTCQVAPLKLAPYLSESSPADLIVPQQLRWTLKLVSSDFGFWILDFGFSLSTYHSDKLEQSGQCLLNPKISEFGCNSLADAAAEQLYRLAPPSFQSTRRRPVADN